MKQIQLSIMVKLIAVTGILFSLAVSASEIDELRKEVNELKLNYATFIQNTEISEERSQVEKKNSTEFNLYGFIRADATLQNSGSNQMYNDINKVPLTSDIEQQKINSSVSFTRIGLDTKTTLNNEEHVNGKLEIDFIGGQNRDQLRIRHAYLQYKNWTIGQTTSSFVAPEYMAPTVDFLAYTGGAIHRTPLISYSHKINKQVSFLISAEDPKYSSTSDPNVDFKTPVLAAKLKYIPNTVSSTSVRTFISNKEAANHEFISWGLGVGGEYSINSKVKLKGNYYHIKADGRYILWSNPAYILDGGNIILNEFDSINAGISYALTDRLTSTFGYGLMKYKNQNSGLDTFNSQNKNLWQGWGNIYYKPANPLLFGIEYVYGERETFTNLTGKDSRINLMASYNF